MFASTAPSYDESAAKALYDFGVNRIANPAVRDAVTTILSTIVDPKFWDAPASSSGKYHPIWQNERSGLVRHTVELCCVAPQIARAFADLCTPDGKDLVQENLDVILAACVLHDAFKGGRPWGAYTNRAHASIAANAWEQVAPQRGVDARVVELVKECVTYHEGRWTPGGVPPEMSSHAIVVHLADMVSSGKDLEKVFAPTPFEAPNVTPIRSDTF